MKQYKQDLKQLPERFSFKGQVKQITRFLIYDPDTINVVFPLEGKDYTFAVRLDGFDAPELKVKQTDKDQLSVQDQEFLKQQYNKSLELIQSLICGKTLTMHCGDFDKYNRILATIYTNNEEGTEINVNKTMIDSKLVFPYQGATKLTIAQQVEFLKKSINT